MVRGGVSSGDRNAGGDTVGSGGEVGKRVDDGAGKGDSKSEVGWRGKSGATGDVGDAVWMDGLIDVGVDSDDVNAGMVKFSVSDSVAGVEGLCGTVGEGIEIVSDVEAMAKVEVGKGNIEGVMGRNVTAVPV